MVNVVIEVVVPALVHQGLHKLFGVRVMPLRRTRRTIASIVGRDEPTRLKGVAHAIWDAMPSPAFDWRLLDDCRHGRCLARLGPGARRDALQAAAHHVRTVWLTIGMQPAGHRDEAWLKKGLPCS